MIKEIDKVCLEEGMPNVMGNGPQTPDANKRQAPEWLVSFLSSRPMVRGPPYEACTGVHRRRRINCRIWSKNFQYSTPGHNFISMCKIFQAKISPAPTKISDHNIGPRFSLVRMTTATLPRPRTSASCSPSVPGRPIPEHRDGSLHCGELELQSPGAYPTKNYKYWFTNICNLHILHFTSFSQSF
jgi:hypothetical protein